MLTEMELSSCEETGRLGLFSLEWRRLRGEDPIKMYTNMKGKDWGHRETNFPVCKCAKPEGISLRCVKYRGNLRIAFLQRVVAILNTQPKVVVEAGTHDL